MVGRGRLTSDVLIDVRQAVESRLGTLSPSDRGLVTRIARAIDSAQRIAARITNQTGRLPYPGEVPVMPGTVGAGEGGYTYVTVISDPFRDTHRGSSVRVVFHSDRILTASEARRAALAAMSRGQVAEGSAGKVPGLQALPDPDFTLISVYRGTLNVVS